jgi:aspartate/methionine/tyrosine aminotransferase
MSLSPGTEFERLKRLPPYVFNITTELKMAARRRARTSSTSAAIPTDPPRHIVDKLIETIGRPDTHGCRCRAASPASPRDLPLV